MIQIQLQGKKVMVKEEAMLQVEQFEYDRFMKLFKTGKFGTQRLGQAFYNHFNLHRLSNQERLNNLYAKDGDHAIGCIKGIFEFT